MSRWIFSETDETDENDCNFGKENQRDCKIILFDDRLAQNPRDGEDEQIINDVRDAVITPKRGCRNTKFARKNAVVNI